MKPFCFLLFLLAAGSGQALHAQEFKTKFPSRQDRRLTLEMHGSDVVVEAYDGDELVVRGDGYEAPPKRAEGLRPVYNSAVDNTRLGLSVVPDGNTLRVVQASRRDVTYTLRVPRRTALLYTETTWDGSDLNVSGLAGSLELNLKSGDATLTGVTGPVVAHGTNGSITLRFGAAPTAPTSVSLINGTLDVTLPAATKAELALRSISGEIYTDFDLNPRPAPDGLTRVGGQRTITVPLNGGGPKLSLHTINGDIFVRKAK